LAEKLLRQVKQVTVLFTSASCSWTKPLRGKMTAPTKLASTFGAVHYGVILVPPSVRLVDGLSWGLNHNRMITQ
jgi:hypothetical protein